MPVFLDVGTTQELRAVLANVFRRLDRVDILWMLIERHQWPLMLWSRRAGSETGTRYGLGVEVGIGTGVVVPDRVV